MQKKILIWAITVVVLIAVLGAVSFIINQNSTVVPSSSKNPGVSNGSNNTGDIIKIIEPSGLYLGITPVRLIDMYNLESSINKKVALHTPYSFVSGTEAEDAGNMNFDVAKANRLWEQGYVIYANAYHASPSLPGFTVDKLLNGDYDQELESLAAQFKSFGKPMFFMTQREPNGVHRRYFGGGFGSNGDMTFDQTNDLTGQFTPPSDPLYSGLGNPNVCDGLERLAAAQRYYYDFFINKHKIDLTFDTAGWVISDKSGETTKITNSGCNDFSTFYPLVKDYSDWISFDFYLHLDNNIEGLKKEVNYLRSIGSTKPIIITELGICDGPNKDSEIEMFMNEVMSNLKEIKALVFWGTSIEGGLEQNSSCPDVSIKPGAGGEKLKEIIDLNTGYFNSCVQFSDQSVSLSCDPNNITPKPNDYPEGDEGSFTGNDETGNFEENNQPNSDSSCMASCLAQGESQAECNGVCQTENSVPNGSSCFASCLESGKSEYLCDQQCD